MLLSYVMSAAVQSVSVFNISEAGEKRNKRKKQKKQKTFCIFFRLIILATVLL